MQFFSFFGSFPSYSLLVFILISIMRVLLLGYQIKIISNNQTAINESESLKSKVFLNINNSSKPRVPQVLSFREWIFPPWISTLNDHRTASSRLVQYHHEAIAESLPTSPLDASPKSGGFVYSGMLHNAREYGTCGCRLNSRVNCNKFGIDTLTSLKNASVRTNRFLTSGASPPLLPVDRMCFTHRPGRSTHWS